MGEGGTIERFTREHARARGEHERPAIGSARGRAGQGRAPAPSDGKGQLAWVGRGLGEPRLARGIPLTRRGAGVSISINLGGERWTRRNGADICVARRYFHIGLASNYRCATGYYQFTGIQ